MSTATHEVISAFIDNEPFDAAELAAALTHPDGRTVLIDLVTLRHIVQPDEQPAVISPARPAKRPAVWIAAAAAGLVMAMVGGYQIGIRREPAAVSPPNATVVIKAPEWKGIAGGGGQ